MAIEQERSVVATLSAKYPIFAAVTIQRWVANEFGKYASAKIQTYIPVLVQRTVDATLRDLASIDGTSPPALRLEPSYRPGIRLDTADRVTTGAR
jgi:hypothetical protein